MGNTISALIFGVFVGMALGSLIGAISMSYAWQEEMLERRLMQFNHQTGNLEWVN